MNVSIPMMIWGIILCVLSFRINQNMIKSGCSTKRSLSIIQFLMFLSGSMITLSIAGQCHLNSSSLINRYQLYLNVVLSIVVMSTASVLHQDLSTCISKNELGVLVGMSVVSLVYSLGVIGYKYKTSSGNYQRLQNVLDVPQ